MLGVGQLVGGDVVKGGHHARLGQQRLDLLGGGARRRRREQPGAAEGQRHHGADDDLAAARLLRLRQRGGQPVRGQCHHHDLPQRGRLGVAVADDRNGVGHVAQLRRLGLGAPGVAGADDDRVAELRPAHGQAGALLAGAAENRDVHERLLSEEV